MKKLNIKILSLFLLVAIAASAVAQDEEPKKKDNSGTNPINFTYDYRLFWEMQQFKDDGGSLNKRVMEFRAPLGRDMSNVLGGNDFFNSMGSRFAVRLRAYYNTLSLNQPDGTTTTTSGIGDFDARIIGIAYANSKWGIAPGLEGFFNTASNDALGSGSNILAPVVFVGFFNLLGKRSIFAPGYQYQFNVDGKNVSRSILDIYFVWILAKGKNWLIINPQPIFDHANDVSFAQVDLEWGFMIVPKSGISGYIRPGFGIGEHRPFNYNFEVAIKFVWR